MRPAIFCLLYFLFGFLIQSKAQVNFTSSNLPIVVINTHGHSILNEVKITADMGIIYNGEGQRNYVNNDYNNYNGKIGIEHRGSSSQSFPKKSYAFETRDENSANLNVSLLGMPDENDWILYGPYSDKSLIRNAIIFKLSNDIGCYATRTKFVELVLNGDYRGVYVLMEKIKRDKNRVNISNLRPEDIEGDQLTGGYIIKIDKIAGAQVDGWTSPFPPYPGTNNRIYYQYHYPQPNDINQPQKTYIQNHIHQWETILYGTKYKELFDGYYDWINMDSFVDHLILNEAARNVDAYRLSAFLYKDKNSKDSLIYAGPIWDFNLGFGNADYYDAWKPNGWQLYIIIPWDSFPTPFWWTKIFEDNFFQNRLKYRWAQLRKNMFSGERISGIIDSLTSLLDEASARNFQRWNILGTYVWPNYFIGSTYNEEINYLKNWITERLHWMDEILSIGYSFVNWKNSADVAISINTGQEITLSKNYFYYAAENIDLITFESDNENVIINDYGNSVGISSGIIGRYKLKGIGWNNDQVVEISPNYMILVGITGTEKSFTPTQFELFQNHPNPFNSNTTIKFTVPFVGDAFNASPTHTLLRVFDILGREDATLVNETKAPGIHEINWDASGLPSGIYFYRLTTGNFSQTKKMILLR